MDVDDGWACWVVAAARLMGAWWVPVLEPLASSLEMDSAPTDVMTAKLSTGEARRVVDVSHLILDAVVDQAKQML